jgi:hypothetical protein
MAIQLKRNDTKDTISYTMTYADGTAVNLTGATVRFVMGKGKTLITSATADIVSAATGKVEYTLKESDTLVAGNFNAEFEVTFSDGKIKTFPSDGYISLRIQPNVDDDQTTYIEDQIAYRVSDIQILKNSIQAQLDQFAVGATNEETAQARVEADNTVNATLKARLDKKEAKFTQDIASLSTSLAQIPNQTYITNKATTEQLNTHKTDLTHLQSKIPNFRNRYFKKDKDVVLAFWGTSLLARTTNTTLRSDGSSRAPLMDSYNVASLLWDKLKWAGQEYRRYDYAGFFTEVGTFTASYNDAAWDDGAYREGHTKFSTDATASVQFVVPVDAWQFNFIYRTDQNGTTQAKVTIAEGNGQMEVWNDSAWVEANGYVFSMKESVATANKGNTTFQKRLKMRCKSGTIDSRSVTKSVTINNQAGTGRFLYWGVEWTQRQYMITLINAARGSHSFTHPTLGLPKYQDNELYGFNPDLILIELPIINEGGSTLSTFNSVARQDMVNRMETWVYSPSNVQSVYSKTNGFATSEIAMFTDTMAVLGGAFNATTSELVYTTEVGTGERVTCKDYYDWVSEWGYTKKEAFLDLWTLFYNDAVKEFGTYRDAMKGSTVTDYAATWTNDGTHINNRGAKVWAKHLSAIFGFNRITETSTNEKDLVENWNTPTLLNGWVAYSGSHPVGYYRDRNRVYLRGLVKSGTIGTAIFQVPNGYKPQSLQYLPAIADSAFARVNIDANGNIIAQLGTNGWFSLEGISYRCNDSFS